MPDHRLKRLRVRSYGRRIDDGNKYAGVRDPSGVTSVSADDATNGGANLASVFESAHEVSTDVFLRVATTNGKNEHHVCLIQPRPAEPIGITRIPAFIIHSCGELRHVVRQRIGLDLSNLPKIADRVGSVPCPSAHA